MATTHTKTVKSSGGDYTSLSAWEAGRQGDLPTLDYIEVADCSGFEDTTGVEIDGWTTDSTRYIEIKADYVGGKWSTNLYRIYPSADGAIHINEGYVRVHHIQMGMSAPHSSDYDSCKIVAIHGGGRPDVRIYNFIIKGCATGTSAGYHGGIHVWGHDHVADVRVWNGFIYDCKCDSDASALQTFNCTGTLYAYNVTIHNCRYGVRPMSATIDCRNVLTQDCDDGFYEDGGSFGSSDYNLSDIATDAPGANSRNEKTVLFVDEAGDDFHLAANDTEARDNGASDPGAGLFSNDVDGQTRGGAWDIGADEYVAAAASTNIVLNII